MTRTSLCRAISFLAATLLLMACEPAAQKAVAPLDIARDTYCSLDGMLLGDYPGPKAQIHYAQGEPEFFCDTVEMFSIYLQPEQQKRVVAVFVTDMGKSTWENAAGHWIDAQQAFYVVGSSRRGSMGPTFASFGDESGARTFIEKNGGRVLRFSEVTPDMATLDGGVIKDKGM